MRPHRVEESGEPRLRILAPTILPGTGDVDLGQFHSIALAVDDVIDADLLAVLRQVDPAFQAVTSPTNTCKVMRYAIRTGQQEWFAVDVLCPLRGQVRDNVTELRALRGGVQVVRHLDFLLYREVNAVVLHGLGIPLNVPSPECYAIHKLLVSELRIGTPQSQAKRIKDQAQADMLIRVLATDRLYELEEGWKEMRDRGPRWRLKADRAVASLPDDTRAVLQGMIGDTNRVAGTMTAHWREVKLPTCL